MRDTTRAVELRLAGASFEAIAEALEFENADEVRRAVVAGIAERATTVREGLETEVARLDRLLSSVWPLARKGDTVAVETALKISDRRVKALAALAGLDDPGSGGAGGTGTGEAATPLDELNARRAARGADAAGAGGPKVASKRRG